MTLGTRRSFFAVSGCLALAVLAASFAIAAAPGKDAKPPAHAGHPEMKLPPGWTEADMKACMDAATPGKMQEHLAKSVGVWTGKNQMWMGPGSEPMNSACTSTVTSIMDGRYIKSEVAGDMPGMGPFNGLGIAGFDNVSQKFVITWIDNHGTGIMNGTGELSKDGKTMTWTFTYNCPVTKKPTTMRQVETYNYDAGTMVMEMFSIEPKSGTEYKCIHIDFTKNK